MFELIDVDYELPQNIKYSFHILGLSNFVTALGPGPGLCRAEHLFSLSNFKLETHFTKVFAGQFHRRTNTNCVF